MTSRKILQTAAGLLPVLCLLLLCACSAGSPASHAAEPSPSVTAEDPPASPPPSAEPEPSAEPTPTVEPYDYSLPAPESEAVEDDWFADAVFLGDSRTDGLRLYGGITQGDFICYKGLMAREFDQKACIPSGDSKITPKEALSQKQYAKIYVMLGLNELDFRAEEFAEDYAALIDQIRELQPDAILYVQSLVPVNDQKAREKNQPHYVTNEKIALFNAELVRLTQERQVILVDVAEALTDENGILPYASTHDGVHFNRDSYRAWFSYLKTHTVDPERLEAAA